MSSRWVVLAAAGVASGFITGGCSGPKSGGSQPVSKEDYVNALAHAVCDNIASCCQKKNYTYSDAQCLARLLATPGLPPDRNFNAQQAGACVDLYASAARSCAVSDAMAEKLHVVCGAVFTGTKAPGAACLDDSECAPPSGGGAFCDFPGTSVTGMCVAVTHAKEGDSCVGTCDLQDGIVFGCYNGSGAAVPDHGGACYTSDGLYCSNQGTCVPLTGPGQDCSVIPCAAGTYCDLYGSGVCQTYAQIGGDCSQGQECVSSAYCGSAGTCQATSSDTSMATPELCSGVGGSGGPDAGP